MNSGPMVYISNDDADAALAACGPRGLALYVGICSIAPPDGTQFTTSYEMLEYRTRVPISVIKRLLPQLEAAEVVRVARVERDDLHAAGFIRCQIREVSPSAIQQARRSPGRAPSARQAMAGRGLS